MIAAGGTYDLGALSGLRGPDGPAKVTYSKRFEWDLSVEALRALVAILPNTDPERNATWIRVLHGIAGAGGDLEMWDGWSAKWGGYDAGKTQRAWDTLDVSSVKSGGGLLREMAEALVPREFEDWRRKWEAAERFADMGPVINDALAFHLPNGKTFPRRPWLYGRRLMRGYVSATIAGGGMGKSSLVMTEIVAMVSGRDLIGYAPRAPLRVWLWNGEDDLTELGRRLVGICSRYNVVAGDLADRLYVDSGREKQIIIAAASGKGTAINEKALEAIKKVVRERRIDVLVIDPFVSAHRVSENDNMAIDMVAKALVKVAEDCHCAVDIVHHVRKPGNGVSASASVDDARGASALINATRHARVLAQMPASVASKFGIDNPKAYFCIQHDATKANMVPPSAGEDWYHFESMGLGNGEAAPADGLGPLEEDKVGVVVRWVPPSKTVGEDVSKVRAAQTEISKGNYRASNKADDWVGPVVAGALGLDLERAGVRGTVDAIVRDWLKRGWLKTTKKQDASRHWKEFLEVGKTPEIQVFDEVDEEAAAVAAV